MDAQRCALQSNRQECVCVYFGPASREFSLGSTAPAGEVGTTFVALVVSYFIIYAICSVKHAMKRETRAM
jgi:hypothetical protein